MTVLANSSIQTALPATPQTHDPELYSQLSKVYAAINMLVQSETDNTRAIATGAVVIQTGQLVTLSNNSGVVTANLAEAINSSSLSFGFAATNCSGAGSTFEVQSIGMNKYVSGLTPGLPVYLSDTVAGSITQVKPSTVGHVVQVLGYATSATSFFYNGTLNYTQL